MSQQTDQLTQINRRQRQKMLLLIKNRTQNTMNRPSPLSTTRPQQKQPSIPVYDLIKQYQSNKTSQPDHSSQMGQIDKSIDYNSTLFKYLKQQSNIGNQASQLINNGSAISVRSQDVLNNIQSNQMLKDNGLLNKIDKLLNTRKNNNNNGIKKVYQEYLQKKSMSNSSGFSNISVTSSNLSNITQNKLKSNTISAYTDLHKLKTIQQQKAIITIDRQELDQRFNKNDTKKNTNTNTKTQKQKRYINNHNSNAKSNNKPPLPSITAIDRQKKKIQQTMQQIKRQQNYEFHDKDSLVLEFSDNQSQQCNTSNLQRSYQKDYKNNNSQQLIEKDIKRQSLNQEKNKLCKQLQAIQRQLQKLERQQQEDL